MTNEYLYVYTPSAYNKAGVDTSMHHIQMYYNNLNK